MQTKFLKVSGFAISVIIVFCQFSILIFQSGCEKEENLFSWQALEDKLKPGYINELAIDSLTSYIYACPAEDVIFLSKDNGLSWTALNNGPANVIDMAINGKDIFAVAANGSVWSSTNTGSSWTTLRSGVKDLEISGKNIFAVTSDGILMSEDNGVNWKTVNNGLDPFSFYNPYTHNTIGTITAGQNLVIAFNSRVFLTEDKGTNWRDITNSVIGKPLSVSSVVIEGENIFLGTYNAGVFRSTDKANTWTALKGIPDDVRSLCSRGDALFIGTVGGVFRSIDNGTSWIPVNNGISANRLMINKLSAAGDKVAVITYSGLFLSADAGNTWADINNGLPQFSYPKEWRPIVVNGNNIFVGTRGEGVFVSNDNGNSWQAINNGLSGPMLSAKDIKSLAVNSNTIAAGTNGSGIFLSNDNGNSWIAMNNGLAGDGLYVWSIAFNGNNIYIGTSGGAFMSMDKGTGWKQVNNGLPQGAKVQTMTINGNTIFAGTNSSGVFQSTDNGNSWIAVNQGISEVYNPPNPNPIGNPRDVLSLAVNGNNIFAGTNGAGIFFSSDNGQNWISVKEGLHGFGFIVNSITISGNNILAGTSGGVYHSKDNGKTWTPQNKGFLGNADVVYSVATCGNYAFAAYFNGLGRCVFEK